MAALTHGMNIGDVRVLAQQLQAGADEIRDVMTRLTGKLNGTPWMGPDRERFVSDWQGHHCAALNQVINALHEASQLASTNAQQQESASA